MPRIKTSKQSNIIILFSSEFNDSTSPREGPDYELTHLVDNFVKGFPPPFQGKDTKVRKINMAVLKSAAGRERLVKSGLKF